MILLTYFTIASCSTLKPLASSQRGSPPWLILLLLVEILVALSDWLKGVTRCLSVLSDVQARFKTMGQCWMAHLRNWDRYSEIPLRGVLLYCLEPTCNSTGC